MATNTYVALDLKTVTSAVSSVTFTSIPSTYTDLVLVINAQASTVGQVIEMQYNNDTSSNYSMTELYGNGASPGSFRRSSISSLQTSWNIVNFPDLNFGNAIIHLMNYSNTTTYKTVLSRTNAPSATYGGTVSSVGLWRSTSAISTLKVFLGGGNFAVGSTFSLYGIKTQPVATAKASGGTISYSVDGYTYHTFTSSGTFTPTQSLSCDVLVVAGGGGGYFGGGGAGGVLYYSGQSVTATGYTVTVGAGGNAGSNTPTTATQGGSSQFGSLTAPTGGGTGGGGASNGGNGGSGGGSATNTSNSFGTGISGQGYNGGTGNWGTPSYTGGGGGGAGGVGASVPSGSDSGGGTGGIGVNTYASWASVTSTGVGGYYAGGGGGGRGGSSSPGGGPGGAGGGGNGVYGTGASGTANTGGGGGGGNGAGGAGGSGIVIIRYAS